MAKLVLSQGGSVLNNFFIDKDRLSIGRDPHNDVRIDDPAVSREHAAILSVGNDCIIEDAGSSNGTYVNGARIGRQILRHGDVLHFGAYHLRFVNPRALSEVNLDATMLIGTLPEELRELRAATATAADGKTSGPQRRASKVRFPSGRVAIVAGPSSGTTVELDRVVVTFGAAGTQLAVITRRPHGYFLTHVEGAETARVNGQRVGTEPRALRRGDVIDVGDTRLEFQQD